MTTPNTSPARPAGAPQADDELAQLRWERDRLRQAIDMALVGGNHTVIAFGLLTPTSDLLTFASADEALHALGAGASYEVWCAWHQIMCARALAGETVDAARAAGREGA